MRWLIDTQLPKRLADVLNYRKHHATHTLDLVIQQLPQIETGFQLFDFIELTRTQIVYHA